MNPKKELLWGLWVNSNSEYLSSQNIPGTRAKVEPEDDDRWRPDPEDTAPLISRCDIRCCNIMSTVTTHRFS